MADTDGHARRQSGINSQVERLVEQVNSWADIAVQRQADTHADRQPSRHTGRQTSRQTGRYTWTRVRDWYQIKRSLKSSTTQKQTATNCPPLNGCNTCRHQQLEAGTTATNGYTIQVATVTSAQCSGCQWHSAGTTCWHYTGSNSHGGTVQWMSVTLCWHHMLDRHTLHSTDRQILLTIVDSSCHCQIYHGARKQSVHRHVGADFINNTSLPWLHKSWTHTDI